MLNVEEKLAKSLTADTTELIPYLPYLLQDLWELGTGFKDIKEMISRSISITDNTKILDLACGKGAVSVQLAKTYSCRVKGVDILTEFIAYANKKAQEYSVEMLCEFKVEDINQSVMHEKCYDIVILGAVGDVLGNPVETILKIKETVKKGGYIFINDAFSIDEKSKNYASREQWFETFRNAGVKLIDECIDQIEMEENNRFNQECIIKRANELKKEFPNKVDLFQGYIESQQAECDELENEIVGVIWLLKVEN